ncbi:MAG: hypothetical protein E6I52_08650 [Chloroflexi bacterium]|nr:MAG: hypothetical protein E6I52_08650 [Chloroflexota bacterium]
MFVSQVTVTLERVMLLRLMPDATGATGVGVLVGVPAGVGVPGGVGVRVAVTTGVGVRVAVEVGVRVAVGVGDGNAVAVRVGAVVAVAVAVAAGTVGVGDGVAVAVGDGVAVAVGGNVDGVSVAVVMICCARPTWSGSAVKLAPTRMSRAPTSARRLSTEPPECHRLRRPV